MRWEAGGECPWGIRHYVMVIATLYINNLCKPTLPLASVISHVWNKVGISAIRFAHDAILIIAIVGRLQPQSTIGFIRFTNAL